MTVATIEALLRAHGVPFKLHEHTSATSLDARIALRYPMERTVKTLAFGELGADRVLLAALVTDDRLDYRAFAGACSTIRARLERPEPAALGERLGVEPGGVAPLPLSPGIEVVLDERVASAAPSSFRRSLDLHGGGTRR